MLERIDSFQGLEGDYAPFFKHIVLDFDKKSAGDSLLSTYV